MSAEDPFHRLETTLEAVWTLLRDGVRSNRSPARYVTLATVGKAGAEARLVVLRGANPKAQTLTFHTDGETSKIAQLQTNPAGTVLVWDPERKFQVRLRVVLTARRGTEAEWDALPEGGKDAYGGIPLPGQPVMAPEHAQRVANPARFFILTAAVREIETLCLGTPHRRARFRDGQAGWIVP